MDTGKRCFRTCNKLGVMGMNYSKWLVRSGCTLECANCGHRIPMKVHYIFCPKCGSEINTEEYERELLNKLGNVRVMRAAKLEGCNLTDEEEEE